MHENNRIIASLPFAGLVAIPQSRESRVRGVCLAIFEAVAVMNSRSLPSKRVLIRKPGQWSAVKSPEKRPDFPLQAIDCAEDSATFNGVPHLNFLKTGPISVVTRR